MTQSMLTSATTTTYTTSSVVVTEKTDKDSEEPNFVTLYLKYQSVRTAVDEWWDTFIYLLESNDDTVDLIDLTKYLIYKATGKDYGVTEYDFTSLFTETTSSLSSVSSSTLLEKIRELIRGYESHTTLSSDGTMYLIEDVGDGKRTVGYGVNLTANDSIDQELLAMGYDTSLGYWLPVELVDNYELALIEDMYATIVSNTSNLELTSYQIAVLVSRAYNAGDTYDFTGSTFEDAYNLYWSTEKTEAYYGDYTNSNLYNESMYTKYMYKPNTSDHKVMSGLVTRRKREWMLFATGYDTTTGEQWATSYNNYTTDEYETNTIGVVCPRYYQSGQSWSSVTLSCSAATRTISSYRMRNLCPCDGRVGSNTEVRLHQM